MSSPCVAMFLGLDKESAKNGNIALGSRGVYLCHDNDGQSRFLKRANENNQVVACAFVNGETEEGKLVFALPCSKKSIEHLGNAV